MQRFYDRKGKQITLKQWTKLFEETNRTIAYDVVGEVRISTVWLGLDMSLRAEDPPLIFETAIFQGWGRNPTRLYMQRYSTQRQAIARHRKLVAEVLGGRISTLD
jgi:hypothetical protein